MAGSPAFKVYDAQGVYQAATKRPEEAGAVVSLLGRGSTIRYQHGKTVWEEGKDGWAGESYDQVAELVWARVCGR
jgi:hypothetical protein